MTMTKYRINTLNLLCKRFTQKIFFSYHLQILVSACLWLSAPQLGLNAAEQGSTQNAFSLFNGHSYQILPLQSRGLKQKSMQPHRRQAPGD